MQPTQQPPSFKYQVGTEVMVTGLSGTYRISNRHAIAASATVDSFGNSYGNWYFLESISRLAHPWRHEDDIHPKQQKLKYNHFGVGQLVSYNNELFTVKERKQDNCYCVTRMAGTDDCQGQPLEFTIDGQLLRPVQLYFRVLDEFDGQLPIPNSPPSQDLADKLNKAREGTQETVANLNKALQP